MIVGLESLSEHARCVWVPMSIEVAARLAEDEIGPLWVHVEPDPGGNSALRQIIFHEHPPASKIMAA